VTKPALVLIGLVVLAAILALLSIIFTSYALAAVALVAFLALLLTIIGFAVPSLRHKQSGRYDHSFLTSLFGGTSNPLPGSDKQDDDSG
jgi:uncharacterized membrane protein YoaK (UPF0700 family)